MVSLDPNIRPQLIEDRDQWDHFHLRWLRCASVYKSSDEDFDWVWPKRRVESVAEELLSLGVELVVVTRGGAGASLFHRSGAVNGESYSIDPVDTVGAGDAYMGSLLSSLWEFNAHEAPELVRNLTAADLARLADRAALCAALTCLRAGADPPNRRELAAARKRAQSGEPIG